MAAFDSSGNISDSANLTLPPGYAEEDDSHVLRSVAIAFIIIEVVLVALRFVSQRLGKRSFEVHDALMLPSLLFCLGLCITALLGVEYGKVGHYPSFVAATDPKAFIAWQKLAFSMPILWAIACALPRLAILALYLRIFIERWQRIACYAVAAMAIAECLACMILSFIQCTPLESLWNPTVPGKCLDIILFFRWAPLPNVVIDILMLLLPLPTIWKLQTSRQVKIGLAATFLTGSIGLVTAIMRTVTFFRSDYTDESAWTPVTYICWSIIEPGVYLIAACLPCYRPLISFALNGSVTASSSRRTEFDMERLDSPSLSVREKQRSGQHSRLSTLASYHRHDSGHSSMIREKDAAINVHEQEV